MVSTEILGRIKNTFYSRLARWMGEVSEMKSEWSRSEVMNVCLNIEKMDGSEFRDSIQTLCCCF